MTTKTLVKELCHWIKEYVGSGVLVHSKRMTDHGRDEYVISFVVRTTSTRASTMATRVKLIVEEVAGAWPIKVEKVLLSDNPTERASLATWQIFVKLPAIKPRFREPLPFNEKDVQVFLLTKRKTCNRGEKTLVGIDGKERKFR